MEILYNYISIYIYDNYNMMISYDIIPMMIIISQLYHWWCSYISIDDFPKKNPMGYMCWFSIPIFQWFPKIFSPTEKISPHRRCSDFPTWHSPLPLAPRRRMPCGVGDFKSTRPMASPIGIWRTLEMSNHIHSYWKWPFIVYQRV